MRNMNSSRTSNKVCLICFFHACITLVFLRCVRIESMVSWRMSSKSLIYFLVCSPIEVSPCSSTRHW